MFTILSLLIKALYERERKKRKIIGRKYKKVNATVSADYACIDCSRSVPVLT